MLWEAMIAPGYILSSCASSRFRWHDSDTPHLGTDEPHFTLLVIFFPVMLEFGGDYPLSEHAPHFHQIVLLISTNEQQLCVLLLHRVRIQDERNGYA
jgi:hypothetical protein